MVGSGALVLPRVCLAASAGFPRRNPERVLLAPRSPLFLGKFPPIPNTAAPPAHFFPGDDRKDAVIAENAHFFFLVLPKGQDSNEEMGVGFGRPILPLCNSFTAFTSADRRPSCHPADMGKAPHNNMEE
jgi:hypothetical protein